MADVRVFVAAYGFLATLKTANLIDVGFYWQAVVVLVGVSALYWNSQVGAALIVVGFATVINAQHVVLVVLVGIILAVFPDTEQRRLLVKTQLTALYLFAGLAKLGPAWTSGAVIDRGALGPFDVLPVEVVIWGVVAAELGLAALIWVAPKVARIVGTAMHVSIVVGMWGFAPGVGIPLLVFNGLALSMLWWSTQPAGSTQRLPNARRQYG